VTIKLLGWAASSTAMAPKWTNFRQLPLTKDWPRVFESSRMGTKRSRFQRWLRTVWKLFIRNILKILVKTCAFFTAGNLRQIADEMIQQKGPRFNRNDRKMMEMFWADFGQLFKGISASLTYAPWRIIVIDSATSRTCQEIRFSYFILLPNF